MLFTSSFYKNLDNEDNDLTGSIQKDYRSSHCSISRRSIQSSFSKTLKKKKSYKLDDLLQNESLISRKNENKVVKSKVRISRDITSGTPDFNKTELDKIKNMKEMIKKHTKSKRNKKLVVPSVKDMTLSQRRRSSMTIQDIINKARENSSFNRTMTGNLQQTTLKAKPLKKRTKLVLQGQSSNYSVTRSHSNIQTVFHGQGVDHSHTNSMMSLGIPMNSNPSKIGDSARVLMSANNSGRGDSKSIPQLSALPPKTPVHVVGKHQRHKTSFTSNNSSFNYKTEHQRDLEESKALPKSSFRRKTSFVDIFNQRLKKFKHGRDNSVSQGDHTLGKDLSETLPKLKMNPSSLANLNTLKVLKRKKKDP
uniref:Uncharacterized protein n=1 Tax=Euplotes crassus TaxID=5936 RepID=A0A7S3KE40_EUPCR